MELYEITRFQRTQNIEENVEQERNLIPIGVNMEKEAKWINDKIVEFYKKNKYLPRYFNAWNEVEITDVAPTLTINCGCPGARSGLLIIEEE